MSGATVGISDPQLPVSYVAPPHDPTTKDLAGEAGRRARFTGAAVRRNHLVLATVEGSSKSGFNLVRERSAQIELIDQDQEAMRFFVEDVRHFVSEAEIESVLFRSLPNTGKIRTNLGYKIEAALQLVPDLSVEIVHFNTIVAWVRHSGSLAPKFIEGLSKWEEDAHRDAIATACYGEMHAARSGSAEKQQ